MWGGAATNLPSPASGGNPGGAHRGKRTAGFRASAPPVRVRMALAAVLWWQLLTATQRGGYSGVPRSGYGSGGYWVVTAQAVTVPVARAALYDPHESRPHKPLRAVHRGY